MSSDRKMEETLVIEGIGVEVVNEKVENNGVVFELLPGQSKLIQINAKKINWSVKSYVSYKIESV